MAIEKKHHKESIQLSSSSQLGVSLKDLPVNKPVTDIKTKTVHQFETDEISAYAHDARLSVLIGGGAILIQLALYFGHVIK